jgi:Polyketide cyclase / dehydrase and lipid transport
LSAGRGKLALIGLCAAFAVAAVPAEAQALDVTINTSRTTAGEVPMAGTANPGTTTFTAGLTTGNINVTDLDNALDAGSVVIDPGDPNGITQRAGEAGRDDQTADQPGRRGAQATAPPSPHSPDQPFDQLHPHPGQAAHPGPHGHPPDAIIAPMGTARASRAFPGTVHDAERHWYATGRWPAWIDGVDRVISVDGDWPKVGASVTWESGPAGRGRVRERVVDFEQRVGQTVDVEDASITGRQSVTFTPAEDEVQIELRLEYKITGSKLLTPVIDFLFIRRAMSRSLAQTLERFGPELAQRGAPAGVPRGSID